ncbi:MAG: DUF5916 domain-containing protein, partial [Saprospiraceae bacterium]|nr:DUF5916 domain-containing protein [Saprospiraceae bacterium]
MRLALLLLLSSLVFPLLAQTLDRAAQQAAFQLKIARTNDPVKVDGDLAETTWQQAAIAGDFWLKWPRDGAPAPQQTAVQCAYDDRYLYVAVTAYDTTPRHVIQSLKRDVGYWDSDGFAVILDPTNTANNGYFFGVSANGVQSEALLSSTSDDMDLNWDNTWLVETRQYPDRWTAEYAIPLRILRFREGQTTWGINFIRNDLTNGLYSVWARIPFQFDAIDVGWTGSLHWDTAPRRVKGNYNIIPYVTAAGVQNFETGEALKIKPNIGLDAKIGIGSGLNLDVTANPDFSQVEIDEQVVNLTRFDIQLPEKRTFFLENGDLFANFGIPPIRPFFSRTIGLDADGAPLPIIGGLRLTGNVNADTRIGAMTMLTGRQGTTPSREYTALAVNRRVFGRSTVAGYFLDREEFNREGELQKRNFSRNAGIELVYTGLDGKWSGWLTHHRSYRHQVNTNNWWGNGGFQYRVRGFSWISDFLHMGENYTADLGFERRIENYDIIRDTSLRIGYNFWFNALAYQFFPKKQTSKLNYIELGGELFNVLNPNGSFNESSNEIYMQINFKNTSELNIGFSPNWADVPVAFKFDDEEDLEKCPALPAGFYRFTSVGVEWNSDYRKPVFFGVSGGGGSFYNGRQWRAGAEFTCRIQPIMNIAVRAQFNQLDFPAPYCDVSILNITPRVEVFFAKNIWWTTFLQYNTQADNFNINSRFQWRFRPMSDLFV